MEVLVIDLRSPIAGAENIGPDVDQPFELNDQLFLCLMVGQRRAKVDCLCLGLRVDADDPRVKNVLEELKKEIAREIDDRGLLLERALGIDLPTLDLARVFGDEIEQLGIDDVFAGISRHAAMFRMARAATTIWSPVPSLGNGKGRERRLFTSS